MAGILLENMGSEKEREHLARKMAEEKRMIAISEMERARALNGEIKMRAASVDSRKDRQGHHRAGGGQQLRLGSSTR